MEMIAQNVKAFDKTAKLGYLEFIPVETSEWEEDEKSCTCCMATAMAGNICFALLITKVEENTSEYGIAITANIEGNDYAIGVQLATVKVESNAEELAANPVLLLVELFCEENFGNRILDAANFLLSQLSCSYEHIQNDEADKILKHEGEDSDMEVVAKLVTPLGEIECCYDYDDESVMVKATVWETEDSATECFCDEIEDAVKALITAHLWGEVYETIRKALVSFANETFAVSKRGYRYNRAILVDGNGVPIVVKYPQPNCEQRRKAAKQKHNLPS